MFAPGPPNASSSLALRFFPLDVLAAPPTSLALAPDALGARDRLLLLRAVLVRVLRLLPLRVRGRVRGGERRQPSGDSLVHLALQGAVPVVFDRVVRASDERLRDLRPSVPVLRVRDDELLVLLPGPLLALDLRVEMVVPPLAALLPDPPGELLRDLTPLLRAERLDELDDLVILLLRPRALHELGVEDFLPAVQALDVRALFEVLG